MAENIVNENSYSKGANFEILFGEYMKSDLGWEGYVIRSQQKGKSNSRGANVDVIAKRKDSKGKTIEMISFFYMIAMIGLIGYAFYIDDDLLIIGGFVIGIAGVLLAQKSKSLHIENAWVECKNLKNKATIDHVLICINKHKDYVESGDKEYRFIKRYFASANGFVDNALKTALENNIECYQLKDGKFEKITYWK